MNLSKRLRAESRSQETAVETLANLREVFLFPSCMVDLLRPGIVESARRVLQRLGYPVKVFPPGLCCGQIAWNSGDRKSAQQMTRTLFRHVQRVPESAGIVSLSGSCTAMMLEMGEEILGAPGSRPRIWEFTEFLAQVGSVRPWRGQLTAKVAVHFSCHALRFLGLKEPILQVLQRLHGLEILEWPAADLCCGFGGTFSLKFPELSLSMAKRKVETLPSGAQILTSADLACLANLEHFVQETFPDMEVLHIAEVVDRGHIQRNDSSSAP